MSEDALSPFVDAYRAEHSARSLDRRALRQRVVAAAGRRRLRRTERLRLLLPFAAMFAGSVAFAASPPVREHLRDAFSFVRGGVSAPTDALRGLPKGATRRVLGPPAPASPERAVAPAPVAPVGVVSVNQLPAEPPSVAPASPRSARTRVEAAPTNAGVSVAPSGAGVGVESVEAAKTSSVAGLPNADLALYRRAHELHFGGADRALALGAWDAYLKAFPGGAFAPEARLNRAVCLAKLGRKAEAEGVLVDIERGRFGADGRRQARKILGALAED
jgi:hypothetical protein